MSVYHQQTPFGGQQGLSPFVSLCFDPVSDVLWTGNTSGQVQAYDGASRMRGVSYFVNRGDPVKKIIASESTVTAACSTAVGAWGKGGCNKWHFRQLSDSSAFKAK
jgi:PAB-dependent poly(A)-specific ribonuclease subunit 2